MWIKTCKPIVFEGYFILILYNFIPMLPCFAFKCEPQRFLNCIAESYSKPLIYPNKDTLVEADLDPEDSWPHVLVSYWKVLNCFHGQWTHYEHLVSTQRINQMGQRKGIIQMLFARGLTSPHEHSAQIFMKLVGQYSLSFTIIRMSRHYICFLFWW